MRHLPSKQNIFQKRLLAVSCQSHLKFTQKLNWEQKQWHLRYLKQQLWFQKTWTQMFMWTNNDTILTGTYILYPLQKMKNITAVRVEEVLFFAWVCMIVALYCLRVVKAGTPEGAAQWIWLQHFIRMKILFYSLHFPLLNSISEEWEGWHDSLV